VLARWMSVKIAPRARDVAITVRPSTKEAGGDRHPHIAPRSSHRVWLVLGLGHIVGCAAALGAVSLGWLSLAPAAIAAAWMASRPAIRRSAFGLLGAAGLFSCFVAWVQRAGPGTTCWQTATASGCDQHLNLWGA